jgi:GH25 family lysozyme M1 (1,4-beta-N-acetylmuramidase)
MNGIDVSHHNGKINWPTVRRAGFEFAIIKCTESLMFKDAMFETNKGGARSAGVLPGYYHFARGNDPVKEAQHFLKNVGDIRLGELVALDYEIYTLSDPAAWCRIWLDTVEKKLGFKPLLYTYHALLIKYDWRKVSSGDFGLWGARYGMNTGYKVTSIEPNTGSWKFWAIWQFSSRGKVPGIIGNVDLNYFKMDITTLKKYGAK